MPGLLKLLELTPSPQSIDYIKNKKQFHLFSLLTEQRHTKTWNLSFAAERDPEAGLKMLLSVDDDVVKKIRELKKKPQALEQAAEAIAGAINSGHRIYFYGCGATGRLAKQMESSFWRPFWNNVRKQPVWKKLKQHLPAKIEDMCVGEMTGADRALVSSLEGFEDLQLIGKLQLEDHGIKAGDVVICVTEGGETSSVIGTILTALKQHGKVTPNRVPDLRKLLYFVYNNPDERLRPFDRSRTVIDEPAITKINLTTGPQGVTGSTRMQATTSETFVMGVVLEEAVYRILKPLVSAAELKSIGFDTKKQTMKDRLAAFDGIKKSVDSAVKAMAKFTEAEIDTYRNKRFSTYFAKSGLVTVYTDNTERSPTFRLFPLDRAQDKKRHCWVQCWTEAANYRDAWQSFLGRPFKGLERSHYFKAFDTQVKDKYLHEAALRSLANGGNDQEKAYDFSFSGNNIKLKGPQKGDLGVAVIVDDEAADLQKRNSAFRKFVDLVHARRARLAAMVLTESGGANERAVAKLMRRGDVFVPVKMKTGADPLLVRRHIVMKMLLNAHSTTIMAALGKVVGNTMTNVSPSNLKLIGRATSLILSHVNDTIAQKEWTSKYGKIAPLTFEEVNAVLIDAIEFVKTLGVGQTAEVALSIIRILESLRQRKAVGFDKAKRILDSEGLSPFLARLNPSLARKSKKA